MELKIWDDFIRREELESSPGVIDEDLVRALTLNTYLAYIREMIETGENQYPELVAEQIETTMVSIFISYVHTFEGRYPEPDEISAYLKMPENVEARKNLTILCVHATMENWPGTEKQLRAMVPMAGLDKIDWDSEERRENAEKWRKRFEENEIIEL